MQVLKGYVRNKILQSAKGEFLSKGFHGASMRVIASEAGITVGNIYRYYDNKTALFQAILEPASSGLDAIIGNVTHEVPQISSLNAYMQARDAFAEQFAEFIGNHGDEIRLLIQCTEVPGFQDTKSGYRQSVTNIIGNYVKQSVRATDEGKRSHDELASEISVQLIDGLTGLIMQVGVSNKHKLVAEVKMLLDLYLNQFRP